MEMNSKALHNQRAAVWISVVFFKSPVGLQTPVNFDDGFLEVNL